MDSFYFSVATLATVGYGDFYPTSETSRLFTAVYILVGVSVSLSAIGVIGGEYLRSIEKSFMKMKEKSLLDDIMKAKGQLNIFDHKAKVAKREKAKEE